MALRCRFPGADPATSRAGQYWPSETPVHTGGGDVLHDDEDVIVRGGELDPVVLRLDAGRNHEIYGIYGISVFAVRDITLDEMAQQAPLVPFDRLTLVKAGVIRAAGLRLEATGRNPRHLDITFDQLDEGVDRLCRCEHEVVVNPYHEQ